MTTKALITDIQRFSIHDGPGIRTTVFLKGCPLHCLWCHNPETVSFSQETFFYPEKCISCGKCTQGCYSGARVVCGREMTVEEVLEEVKRDAPYYGCEGGVTVSGGEPLAHRAFTLALLRACRAAGIGTAMESSMYRHDPEILAELDLLMADIKIFDGDLHRRYTGMDNAEILANIKKADEMGVPMIVRTPIVSGVNDTADNIAKTAAFLKSLHHVARYELLPYHPLGQTKAAALGQDAHVFEAPTKAKMEELQVYADLS
ncbi:MAG: glycyl-radical enzyme activating protein [Clostridia bacterium]|nr:glycyl-radical enzyme activating protein [Clostridia bacterium]